MTVPLGVVHTRNRFGAASPPARAERGDMASRNGSAIAVPAVPVNSMRREIGRRPGMGSLLRGDPLGKGVGRDDGDEQRLQIAAAVDERCEQVVGDTLVV